MKSAKENVIPLTKKLEVADHQLYTSAFPKPSSPFSLKPGGYIPHMALYKLEDRK